MRWALAGRVSRYLEAELRTMLLFILARIRFDIWPLSRLFWKVVHTPTLPRSGPALARFQPTFAAVFLHIAVCIQLGGLRCRSLTVSPGSRASLLR